MVNWYPEPKHLGRVLLYFYQCPINWHLKFLKLSLSFPKLSWAFLSFPKLSLAFLKLPRNIVLGRGQTKILSKNDDFWLWNAVTGSKYFILSERVTQIMRGHCSITIPFLIGIGTLSCPDALIPVEFRDNVKWSLQKHSLRMAWAGGTWANYPDIFENHQFLGWSICNSYLSSLLFSMYHYVRMRPGRKLTSDMLGDFENNNVFQSRCLIRSNTHTGAQ